MYQSFFGPHSIKLKIHTSNQIEVFFQAFDFEQKTTKKNQFQVNMDPNIFLASKMVLRNTSFHFCSLEL